jgi:uncharacterized protein YoxC
MYLEVCLLILSIILILLVVSYISILYKIMRSSKDLTITLQTINQSLPTILKNLEEITTNVNNATAVVNRKIQNFSSSVGKSNLVISDVVDNLKYVSQIAMRLPVFRAAKNVVGIIKGVSVFIRVLFNKDKG